MTTNRRHLSLPILGLTFVTLLLSGCAAAAAEAPATAPGSSSTSGRPAAESSAASPTPVRTSTPPPAAQMICAEETQGNVAKILSVSHPSRPEARWADDRYTCTYRVPSGTLQLSVKQSADGASAREYFTAQQKSADNPQSIEGLANLGLPAYQTPDGKVSFVKDNMTLLVDGSGLGPDSPGKPSRTHLAYQLATAILGCWSE